MLKPLLALLTLLLITPPAHAAFIISSAVVEFGKDSGKQQDIELISRSRDNDYIVSEIYEIIHPGQPDQNKKRVENPEEGRLLVTPDKTILPAGGRKVLRFVLLHETEDDEHIYRVQIKPVIRGVDSHAAVGLKVLIGYEALVIVRPTVLRPAYAMTRHGKSLTVSNSGNTSVLLQYGQQCPAGAAKDQCKQLPVMRVYAGQTAHIELPLDMALTYSVWDGNETVDKKVE